MPTTHLTRQTKRCTISIVLAVVSLAAALVAAEVLLRLAVPPLDRDLSAMRLAAARREGLSFDPRTTLEVLEDLRAEGIPAFPPVKPFNFLRRTLSIEGREVVPLAGVANATTVFNANETGEHFVYQSDEYGFHNPPGLHLVGNVDITVIGDSFAQGVAVRSDQNIASLLRDRYPQTLNLGMGASGPLIELAILHEYARPLQPRIVLWLYYEANDLSDVMKESQNDILAGYLSGPPAPMLRKLAAPLNRALIDFSNDMLKSYKKSLATARPEPSRFVACLTLAETRRRIASVLGNTSHSPRDELKKSDRDLDLLRRVIRTACDWTEGWGGQFVFVYLPEFARFSDRWDLCADSLRRPEVLAVLEAEGIATIDLLPVFQRHDDPKTLFPFRLPGHYNATGYRLVAETILHGLPPPAESVPE